MEKRVFTSDRENRNPQIIITRQIHQLSKLTVTRNNDDFTTPQPHLHHTCETNQTTSYSHGFNHSSGASCTGTNAQAGMPGQAQVNPFDLDAILARHRARWARSMARGILCRFCIKTNASDAFCRTHTLRDACGKLTCPVLRSLHCPLCGATGDDVWKI